MTRKTGSPIIGERSHPRCTPIAQTSHNQTDTDIPARHAALNPRALGVQMDISDRFL